MLRLVSDENFSGDIVRGLVLRRPTLDLVRLQDTGLEGVEDPAVLAWAAEHNRILLTHDRATMPDFAYARRVEPSELACRWCGEGGLAALTYPISPLRRCHSAGSRLT